MNILLISTNSEKGYPYPVAPVGIGYVNYYFEKEGHNVRLLDLCFLKKDE